MSKALAYYKQNKEEDFVQLLDRSRTDASLKYENHEMDQLKTLDLLAAYYVMKGNKERNSDKKRDLFAKATVLYTAADKIIMYEPNHLVGRALFCLSEPAKMDQSESQFEYVLKQVPSNIPALLGQSSLSLHSILYYLMNDFPLNRKGVPLLQ